MSNLIKRDSRNLPQRRGRGQLDLRREPAFHIGEMGARDEMNLPNLFFFLRRVVLQHKWLILVVTLTVAGTTALQLLTMSPVYKSAAKIQVDPDQDMLLPYKDVSDATVDFLATEAYVQAQKEILESRRLGRNVVRSLGLGQDAVFNTDADSGLLLEVASALKRSLKQLLVSDEGSASPGEEEFVDRLLENLDVKLRPGTRILEIRYEFHDADLVGKIVNSYVEEFVRLQQSSRREILEQNAEFLTKQISHLAGDIEGSEAKMKRYARE